MSTKPQDRRFAYCSLFMLVRVHAGPVRLVIPISLFVLDQTLAAVQELVWLAERLVPGLRRRIADKIGKPGRARMMPPPSESIHLCRELIQEMRSYGKWRMVEVATRKGREQTYVYVDFF